MSRFVSAARERLMDLTSREGDWFLDELCSMSGNVSHLVGLLNDVCLDEGDVHRRQEMFQVMQATHAVYVTLQVRQFAEVVLVLNTAASWLMHVCGMRI